LNNIKNKDKLTDQEKLTISKELNEFLVNHNFSSIQMETPFRFASDLCFELFNQNSNDYCQAIETIEYFYFNQIEYYSVKVNKLIIEVFFIFINNSKKKTLKFEIKQYDRINLVFI
jgi:hypothetical protein